MAGSSIRALRAPESTVLDLRFIRENLEAVRANCAARHVAVDLDRLIELDELRRSQIAERQTVQQQRNELAKAMKGRKPTDAERGAGKELKERDAALEVGLLETEAELRALHLRVPNLTHPDVPLGREEADNRELRRSAEPTQFGFTPKDHLELAELHDLIDFDAGAKVAGHGWYYLKNEAVLLEQALVRWALDFLRERGFQLVQTPDVARSEVADGLGYNPRGDESNIYTIADSDLVLIGTSEITIGGMHRDEILDAERLPLYYAGLSHCFRVEAGAHGRASRGLYRVHQFTKVEMFCFCHPDDSERIHERFVAYEEELFRGLEIPFRVVDVCTGDLGAPAYRKYDLEAWMPMRGEHGDWGEITSTSNCTDYQARRLNVRFRDPETQKPRFVHMLNGTAIALSRGPVALLETHQQADGSIRIPKALVPYTGFERIG